MGYEYPKLIDNKRRVLADVIKNVADKYNKLSIATGYWDLPGTAEVIDHLQNYKSIRLLIGNEPLLNSYLLSNSQRNTLYFCIKIMKKTVINEVHARQL